MPHFVLGWASCLLAATALSAQEKHTLKSQRPEKTGDREHRIHDDNFTMGVSIKDGTGKAVKDDKESKKSNADYIDDILAKEGDKRATKVSRAYKKVTHVKDGATVDLGLDGKTVVCERKDKTYQFTLADGGKLSPAALEWLNDEFKSKSDDDPDRRDRALMPKVPVAVGETWKCDTDEIIKVFAEEGGKDSVDVKKATATGKLLKIYEKGNKKFGVIDVTIDLPLKSVGPPGQEIKCDAGSFLKMKGTLDVCIDGSETNGTMSMSMDMKATGTIKGPDGNEYTMKLTATGKGTETREPAK